MTPTTFPEANTTLSGGPAPKYGTADPVVDLPVHKDGYSIVSCWALSWRDRLRLLVTGRVWLSVLAPVTHHPVKLTTESPFEPGSRVGP